jgi:hypothetical protein
MEEAGVENQPKTAPEKEKMDQNKTDNNPKPTESAPEDNNSSPELETKQVERSNTKKSKKSQKSIKTESLSQIDPLLHVRPPSPEPKLETEPTKPAEKVAKKDNTKDPFPYRHYPSLHICSNRLLEMRWDRTLRDKHLKKLQGVKATVDNTSPKPYKHLLHKYKKIQMEEGSFLC